MSTYAGIDFFGREYYWTSDGRPSDVIPHLLELYEAYNKYQCINKLEPYQAAVLAVNEVIDDVSICEGPVGFVTDYYYEAREDGVEIGSRGEKLGKLSWSELGKMSTIELDEWVERMWAKKQERESKN